MPQYLVKATNKIHVYGPVLRVEMTVGANATKAKMIPGTIVVYDAAVNAVKEAGVNALSFLGVIDIDATHDMDDTYDVGDNIPILVPAPGAFLMIRMTANENLTQGDLVVVGADGLLVKQIVGAMGTQGAIVGQIWETWNVAAIEHVLVLYSPTWPLAAAA